MVLISDDLRSWIIAVHFGVKPTHWGCPAPRDPNLLSELQILEWKKPFVGIIVKWKTFSGKWGTFNKSHWNFGWGHINILNLV